jgi:transposase
LVTDGQGLPVAVEVTAGQINDCSRLESVMDRVGIPQPIGRPRLRPERLAGDKGYSSAQIRRWLKAHGIEPIIPIKSDQQELQRGNPLPFDKVSYRRRSIIEQCVGWLKEARRIGTRFEKLAINFLAMLKLAMINRYLRFEFSDTA